MEGRAAQVHQNLLKALWLLVMVSLIVGLDLTLLRDARWFWERLAVNVGIVLVSGGLYFRFMLS